MDSCENISRIKGSLRLGWLKPVADAAGALISWTEKTAKTAVTIEKSNESIVCVPRLFLESFSIDVQERCVMLKPITR